jgi:hypothetical protein
VPGRSTPRLAWANLGALPPPAADAPAPGLAAAPERIPPPPPNSERGAAKAAANLAQGRAAKDAADRARRPALAEGFSAAEARQRADTAARVEQQRPLENFMSEEHRQALLQPAAVDDIPPAPIGGAWEKGELKALHNAKPGSRGRVLANLIRGRYARAAGERARAEATATGASADEIARTVQRAAREVMARPLEEFTPEGRCGSR